MGETSPYLYTVLMPVAPWEDPAVVGQALDSLANQSLPANQVVLACDGKPPDDLKQVLVSKNLPLEFVLGPGSEGVGPILARGLERCRNNLIVRADADDISHPQRCAVQVSWMVEHPDISALSCAIGEFEASPDILLGKRIVPVNTLDIQRTAWMRNPMNHPSTVFRRNAVMAVGGYRNSPGFEDYDLWLRLLASEQYWRLENLPDTLVFARTGPNHLARRHGIGYALKEGAFFVHCANQRLIAWHYVLLALAIRLPLRILPSTLLRLIMRNSRKRECLISKD